MSRRKTADAHPIRVLLVDDHAVVRIGSRALIDSEADMSVVGEASTAAECLIRLEEVDVDVAVLDVRLPDLSGVDLCRAIRDRRPEVNVVMLTAFADDDALMGSFDAGASGFVLKNVRGGDLIVAIRTAHSGRRYVDPSTAERISGQASQRDVDVLKRLSPQEKAVAHYLARGLTNREIAFEMGLAEKTVKNYVSNLLSKLGMARRSQAAARVAYAEATRDLPPYAESWEELRAELQTTSP